MDMPQGPFCQSCAMPMLKPEDFGTSADDSPSQEYCHFCFTHGQFTDPDMTLQQMIDFEVGMADKMGMTPEEAKQMATTVLPTLKRWKV